MATRKIGISLSLLKSEFGPLLYSGNMELGLRTASSLGYSGVEHTLDQWLNRIKQEFGE